MPFSDWSAGEHWNSVFIAHVVRLKSLLNETATQPTTKATLKLSTQPSYQRDKLTTGKRNTQIVDIKISFNLFGKYNRLKVWDAAEEKCIVYFVTTFHYLTPLLCIESVTKRLGCKRD